MMKKNLAFLFCFFVLTVTAQERKDSIPKIYTSAEIEIKGIRANAKAPFTKINLSKEALNQNNLAQDIPFLLNQTPSVVVNSDAGNGVGYTGIRIRGTDATRINMTINGIPYNDAESQGIFFVNLPDFVSSVSSLQIQRGIGSSSNGAGAFGATLSFSTHEKNDKAAIEFNNSFGSFQTLKNTLKLSTGLIGKYLTLDGRISQIKTNGFIDRASSNLKSAFVRVGFQKKNTSVTLNIISGKEKTYQAWYGILSENLKNNRTFNSAGTEKANAPYANETDNYLQNHYQLILNQKVSGHLNFSTASFYTRGKGYYEQYKADQKFSNYGLQNVVEGAITYTKTDLIRQLWLDNDFFGQTFNFLYNKGQSNFTFGGLISKYLGNHFGQVIWAQRGIAKNYKWYDLDANKTDQSAFVKWQYAIDAKLTTTADLQYRKVQYSINGFRNNPAVKVKERYNFFNPKFGIFYADPLKHNTFSLSYALSTKEPNRDDFEANINQLPKPEKLEDIECNYTKKINKVQFAATVYYMNYNNQLILNGRINDVGAYTRENVAKSYRTGIELNVDYTCNSKLAVNANFTVSKNKIRNFNNYYDDYDNGGQISETYTNRDIALSPNRIAAATIVYKPFAQFEIRLSEKMVSKQFLDNTQSNDKKLDGYFTQDIIFNYKPTSKKINNCNLVLQINNIFNAKYEPNGYSFSYLAGGTKTSENYVYPMAGINFMLGLQIGLHK